MKIINRRCPSCGAIHTFKVTDEQYQKYVNGEDFIQNIFPELSAADREILITGICENCWNEMFPPEEDED